MPKIIENLPQRLIEEARRQIQASGYSALTIRSVARACGVGVGTVYNYYPSKDAMVAAFLLEDWNRCVRSMEERAAATQNPESVLRTIHEQLSAFYNRHVSIFQDASAAAGFSGSFGRYHGLLRSQLSAPLQAFCQDTFTADFIAEAMLVWTVSGKTFEALYPLIQKLL